MDATSSPNAEYIQVWNNILVPRFTRFRDVFVRSAQAHSDVALARHPPRPGERVLDVGCGFGETAIQIARLVAPGGAVLGIDPCEPFLETARADAARVGVGNVSFVHGDAQIHRFDEPFDLLFGRFGIMFFVNPAAALRHLRAAMRPGGRTLFLVWRALDENLGFAVAKQIARVHLPPPPDDGAKCGPGPFSMADPELLRTLFATAGFHDVAIEPIDVHASVGDTLDQALELALTLGPAGEILREAGAEGQAKLPAIVADLRAELARYLRDDGVIVPQASWCIVAHS